MAPLINMGHFYLSAAPEYAPCRIDCAWKAVLNHLLCSQIAQTRILEGAAGKQERRSAGAHSSVMTRQIIMILSVIPKRSIIVN